MSKQGTAIKLKFNMRWFYFDVEVLVAAKYIYTDADYLAFEMGDPLPERPELGEPKAIYWLVWPVDFTYQKYFHAALRRMAHKQIWPKDRPDNEFMVIAYILAGGDWVDMHMADKTIQIRKGIFRDVEAIKAQDFARLQAQEQYKPVEV